MYLSFFRKFFFLLGIKLFVFNFFNRAKFSFAKKLTLIVTFLSECVFNIKIQLKRNAY